MSLFQNKIYAWFALAAFIPNIIGASILILYFSFFNLSQPIYIQNTFFSILLTVLIFLINFLYTHRRRKKWQNLLNLKQTNQISPAQLTELKKISLNQNYSVFLTTLFSWVAAAVAIPLSLFLQGSELFYVFPLFFSIFFLGGSFSIIISFYLNEMVMRRIIAQIFPNEDFHEISGIKNIRFYIRLMIAFWVGGILPTLLSAFFSNQYQAKLLSESFLPSLSFKYQVLMILVIGLSLLMSFLSSFYFKQQMGQPLIQLENSMQAVESGNLDLVLPVTQKDEIGNVFGSFNRMVKGLKEREILKDLFGKFVSTDVRDILLSGDLKLGGAKTTATILFCDIRNFTSLSEKMQPAEVVEMLNAYFNEMLRPILSHQGILDKFIGDALMAVFGAPQPNPAHAENAVKAAIAMLEKLNQFNQQRINEGKIPIFIGIGVNTGEIIAGNIGCSERMEYTVIGDHVNIASRLESLTKDFQAPLIISEYTYEQLSSPLKINFESLGSAIVKGRENSIKIYCIKNQA